MKNPAFSRFFKVLYNIPYGISIIDISLLSSHISESFISNSLKLAFRCAMILEKILQILRPETKGFVRLEYAVDDENSMVYFVTPEAAKRLKIKKSKAITYNEVCRIGDALETGGTGVVESEIAGMIYFLHIPETIDDIYVRTVQIGLDNDFFRNRVLNVNGERTYEESSDTSGKFSEKHTFVLAARMYLPRETEDGVPEHFLDLVHESAKRN